MHEVATPEGLNIDWAPATLADAAELANIYNLISEVEETPERFSPETMEHDLDAAYRPLDQRTVVGRSESGEAVAFSRVYYRSSDADEQRAYFGVFVTPDWQGKGLEDPLNDWAIEAAQLALEDVSAPRKYICCWLYKKQQGRAARLERLGFEAGRHWWEMERMLDEVLPDHSEDGFDVIPWSDEHVGPTRLVCNAAFLDHWGFTPMSEETWQKQVVDSPGFRQDLSFVAVDGDDLVGYSYNVVQEEDWEAAGRSEGWIGGLGVLSEWRKKGIATALIARSMQAMKTAGLDAAMIGVDSASSTGAQHLYHAVGFRTQITGTTWQRELI